MTAETILKDINISDLWVNAGQKPDQFSHAVAQAILDGLCEQKPFMYLRTLNGEPDWSEDCVADCESDLIHDEEMDAEGYGAMPLYASPMPAVTQELKKIAERNCAVLSALRALELACDDLAAARTRDGYLLDVESGRDGLLLNLDNARRAARGILNATIDI